MAGFDDPGLYYADRIFEDNQEDDVVTELQKAKALFKKFIREYNNPASVSGDGHQDEFPYRSELRRLFTMGQYYLQILMNDFKSFAEHQTPSMEKISDDFERRPSQYLPVFEEVLKEVADEYTKPRPEGQEVVPDIQLMIGSNQYSQNIRSLKSNQVSRFVKLQGIIISASQVRSKATKITLQCRNCRHTKANIDLKPGLEGYALPRRCGADQVAQAQKCPMDPYHIVPDRCECVDFQVLKMQETPDEVPHGEMPRHMQLYCDRYLTDRVAPGNRVTVTGIYSIKKASKQTKGSKDKISVGLRAPYVRVLDIQIETSGPGRSDSSRFTDEEERKFRELAAQPDVFDRIVRSIAPSIYGCDDIKRAAACLLFGGSRKRMPDGLTRRGDVNILLLGDPGTAKSQLLKFVENVAPIGVYTSGKGSSAAGLTASVNRDPVNRSFVMEGGAMVLADGGVVCIDEFDKMREDDRVAIHEAMEQQTISIAKAGITTTLNSRCSVLAAANSVFGRWKEDSNTKAADNIEFMPTILSRFDMIFIVKDEHDERRDMTLAKHVIQVHVQAVDTANVMQEGELSLQFLKRFIAYCRARCGPRLSDNAGQKLINKYVRLRNPTTEAKDAKGRKEQSHIPITVRQLEAIVRISESLAKMQLQPFATEKHVDEAMRLFTVSTLEAAQSGNLAGVEGFTTDRDQELLNRIETQIKKRFTIGTQVSEHVIVSDFVKQHYNVNQVRQVLNAMIRRQDIVHQWQRKMLFRVR